MDIQNSDMKYIKKKKKKLFGCKHMLTFMKKEIWFRR